MTCKKCGAELSENAKFCAECGEAIDMITDVETEFTLEGKQTSEVEVINGETQIAEFVPDISLSEIQNLSREKTMELLCQVRDIAIEAEKSDSNVIALEKRITIEREAVEKIRNRTSSIDNVIICIALGVALFFGIKAGSLLLTIVFVVIALIVAGVILVLIEKVAYGDIDKEKAADEYNLTHVEPLVLQLEKAKEERDALLGTEKLQWAKEIVGDDMFFSSIISVLHDLIKSRRADNLKEALNKFDDEIHKQQMEEMQKAIHNEAQKQTDRMRQIERHTQEAAAAAKLTAATSQKTYKNIKSINKKLR